MQLTRTTAYTYITNLFLLIATAEVCVAQDYPGIPVGFAMTTEEWNQKNIPISDSIPDWNLVLFQINSIYCAGVKGTDSIRYWRIFTIAKEARLWEFCRNQLQLKFDRNFPGLLPGQALVRYEADRERNLKREGDYQELLPFYDETIRKKATGVLLINFQILQTNQEFTTSESIHFSDRRNSSAGYEYSCIRQATFKNGVLVPGEIQCIGEPRFPGGMIGE